jgi:hypothetical protein
MTLRLSVLIYGVAVSVAWPAVGLPIALAGLVAAFGASRWRGHWPISVSRRPASSAARLAVQATSIAEGFALMGGAISLPLAGLGQWWLIMLITVVAIHLTTVAWVMRRRIDAVLVPLAWIASDAGAIFVSRGDWRLGWTIAGGLLIVITAT